jgi:hypothetical protein
MFDIAIRASPEHLGYAQESNEGRRISRSYRPHALSQILSSRGDVP